MRRASALDDRAELSYKLFIMSRDAQTFATEALRAGGVVRTVDKSAKRKR